MTISYTEFSQKPASEKVQLCIAHATQKMKLFTLNAGSVYYRDVDHWVSAISVDGVSLTAGVSTVLSAGQFYFNPLIKRLYVRMSDSSNPKTKDVVCTFKFFFSNQPYNLPMDLNAGTVVEWEPRIDTIGQLGQQLDDENTGIVLESSSSIALHNSDGFFDDTFDTLVWENQLIEFWSWSPLIAPSSAYKLFSGVIESKSFASDKITFKVRDFVYKLKDRVNLGSFSESDGDVSPNMIGKPKRRIYGQVKQAQCIGIDKTLNGYPLTGTFSVTIDTIAVTGTGTAFLDELSPGDELFTTVRGETFRLEIDSIASNTALTLGKAVEQSFIDVTATVKPNGPWRKKNRRWHIAGHKLRAPSAAITAIDPGNTNRITVDSNADFFADDSVKINSEYVLIRRISTGNNVVLQNSLSPLPVVTDLMVKNPVSKVYFGNTELVIDRDWTLTNTTEAILEIDPLAEFNVARQRNVGVNLSFTNLSRTITTSATIDLRTILKPRDWIRKNLVTESDWYEILDVQQQTITLRTAFAGATNASATAYMKNVDIIDDDSLITVNAMGMEFGGEWMKTASDCVKHLITEDAGFTAVDDTAFDKAKAECDWILSMVIPEGMGDTAPMIRDVITKINDSVFGSLYGNQSQEIAYSVLNSRKPESLAAVLDEDILSWSSVTTNDIVNKVNVYYNPFVDIYSGDDALDKVSFESEFVNRMTGITNTEERTVYLYEEDKATIMAQRIAFFLSLSNCKVTVKAKLGFSNVFVNDKVYLSLDRMFRRYGGRDRMKIGSVTSVKKNGLEADVEFTDIGNIFNRVPAICPNTTSIYASSTRDDAMKWGFIVDNDTLTPDNTSEVDLGNNLIG